MSRPVVLVLAAAVSAFALVLVGAAATYRAPSPSADVGEAVPLELVRAREAEYQRLLVEANARLGAQPAAAPAPDAPVVEPAPLDPDNPRERGEHDDHERDHRRSQRRHGHVERENDDG